MRNRTVLIAVTAALAAVTPSTLSAQKLGQGGTGVDDTTALPHCDTPLGVAAMVEQKTANPTDSLSPQLQALMRMAEMQNGGSTANVDPLPLVKLMAARSGCFRVADRGDAFTALERERAIAGASAPARQITKADYLLQVQVVYSDAKSRESGVGVGGVFGGAVGLKSKTLESQVLLTLVDVDTGIQEAVASGSASKKDIGVIGGGLLSLGVGALGGTYGSTDIGKITSLAMLDAYRKLITDAQPRLAARLRPAPQALPAPATSQPAVPSTAPRR